MTKHMTSAALRRWDVLIAAVALTVVCISAAALVPLDLGAQQAAGPREITNLLTESGVRRG